MSFLDSLGLNVIKNEKEMLYYLRDSAEGWYNELTEPFLPILNGKDEGPVPYIDDREEMVEIARKMSREEVLINNGDALENKIAEIEKSSGIPFVSGRNKIREHAEEYLNSGVFLKTIGNEMKNYTNSTEYHLSAKKVRNQWRDFKIAKDEFIKQINKQLANIG